VDIAQVQSTWNAFGETDPMWAVLTESDKKGNRWAPDEFFATGRRDVGKVLALVTDAGLRPKFGRALDFGCGVGRLTQALAGHFAEVHGLDIAPSMLEAARKYDRGTGKCTFHLNSSDDLRLFPDGHFDFVCSLITLQHIEPRYSAAYLREMLRVLAPGGVLVFQLPTRMSLDQRVRRLLKPVVPPPLLRAYRRLRYGEEHAVAPERFASMEMYGTARWKVKRLLAAAGGRAVSTQRDRHADGWASYVYVVTKRVSP
jgi:SAM-dependent methyltransferase